MKAFYNSKLLSNLTFSVILFIMVMTVSPTVDAGTNNNAFIITTVDNIKGQYTMLVFQNVCTSEAYEEYEFILLNGSDDMYRKSCICEKYQQYSLTDGEPWLYKQKFWKIVKDCEVPYVINEFEDDGHGDIKAHQNELGFNGDLQTKFVVDASGALALKAEFSVYPNPAKEFFILDYQLGESDFINMHLYDALGKEVNFHNSDLVQEPGIHSTTFDISALNTGVYFYVVMINNEKSSGRLIITD